MFKKVAFTIYPVTNVARARAFYEETFGLEVGMAGGQGDMHWIEYDLPGGGCLALTNTTGGCTNSIRQLEGAVGRLDSEH